MLATQEVLFVLRSANPGIVISEDRVRHAIRRGQVAPRSFASRLAWTREDVAALATALGLVPPKLDGKPGCVATT